MDKKKSKTKQRHTQMKAETPSSDEVNNALKGGKQLKQKMIATSQMQEVSNHQHYTCYLNKYEVEVNFRAIVNGWQYEDCSSFNKEKLKTSWLLKASRALIIRFRW